MSNQSGCEGSWLAVLSLALPNGALYSRAHEGQSKMKALPVKKDEFNYLKTGSSTTFIAYFSGASLCLL